MSLELTSPDKMFSAASYQFAKSVGKHTLHPVPSIDEKSNIKPLQLVIKSTKRRFIFFEKAVYKPSEFNISNVLTDDTPMNIKLKTDTSVEAFNRTTKVSLTGKFGVDIKKEILDVELETDDSVTLDIKFGKVIKTEVVEPDLMEELNSRRINMDHDFIRQIREDRSKVLCVVTGLDQLPDGGTIHRVTSLDGKVNLTSKILPGASSNDEVMMNKDRDIVLAPNTPVAYTLRELNVDKRTGAIQLVLTSDKRGGFRECIDYDEVDAPPDSTDAVDGACDNRRKLSFDIDCCKDTFKPFINLPADQRETLNGQLLTLLSIPRDVIILNDTIEEALKSHENKMLIPDMTEKLLVSKDTWLGVLQTVGFVVNGDELIQPPEGSPLLKCLVEFLDAASEMDEDVMVLLNKCSRSVSQSLILVLQDGMKGETTKDPDVIQALQKDNHAMELLKELLFEIGSEEILPPKELVLCIDGVYWVTVALWAKCDC